MKRLSKIYLEITNTCNLTCPFCPPHNRPPHFMSEPEFRAIIEKISGRADVLFFHIKGEPLLHPSLSTFIDIAGEAGFRVNITTNGTMLESAHRFLTGKKNLARINVSMHSLPQFAYAERNRLTRAILETAEILVADNLPINPEFLVSLRLWTKDDTGATEQSLKTIAEYFNLEPLVLEETLSKKNGSVLAKGIALHTGETFSWPSLEGQDFGPSGFCHALRDQAGILADGTVVPCCLDGDGIISLGNILQSDWNAIIGGPRARALYDGFSQRKAIEPLCRRCGFRTRFDDSSR